MNTFDVITDRITAMLEQGVVPWRKSWSDGSGDAPMNGATARAYRGVNVFVLWAERFMKNYSAPVWFTFKQANEAGGKIIKGSHGVPVVYRGELKVDRDDVDVNPESGEPAQKTIAFLRYSTVFNIDQIEFESDDKRAAIIERLKIRTPDYSARIERAEMIVKNMPNCPTIAERDQSRACYSPALDLVVMPLRQQFVSMDMFYHSLFHEIGHSTAHESRLNRMKNWMSAETSEGCDPYGYEELVAEMTAAFVGAEAGLSETVLNDSASYIDGWIKAIKKDRRILVFAAGAAQKAADYILGNVAAANKAAA